MTPQEAAAKVWPLLTAETDPMPAWAGLDEVMNLSDCEANKAFRAVCNFAVNDALARRRREVDNATNGEIEPLIRLGSISRATEVLSEWLVLLEGAESSPFTIWYASLKRPLEILAEMQSHLPTQRAQEV